MTREEVIEVLTNALDGLGTAWVVDEAISAAIKLPAADTNVARKSPSGAIGPDAGDMAPNGDEGARE